MATAALLNGAPVNTADGSAGAPARLYYAPAGPFPGTIVDPAATLGWRTMRAGDVITTQGVAAPKRTLPTPDGVSPTPYYVPSVPGSSPSNPVNLGPQTPPAPPPPAPPPPAPSPMPAIAIAVRPTPEVLQYAVPSSGSSSPIGTSAGKLAPPAPSAGAQPIEVPQPVKVVAPSSAAAPAPAAPAAAAAVAPAPSGFAAWPWYYQLAAVLGPLLLLLLVIYLASRKREK